ncbi:putative membrane protein [Halorhabdus sp. SVX81]|uniref:hypothetical protein n=1 Tax=Halorhabdus sp. SVX81 TaxID=2978283 RepID=UPI0023DAA8E0|nr:hypothetical protein [Halorhabdus sp. SVX81]WEL17759.1 putative membrane protein [Halorhabdus sp. SVX81]
MAEIDISGDDDGSDVDAPSSGSPLPYFLGKRIVILAIVVGIVFLVRPLVHGVVYAALFSPSGLVLIGGGTITALTLWFYPPWRLEREKRESNLVSMLFEDDQTSVDGIVVGGGSAMRKLRILGAVLSVLFVLSILASVPAGALEQRTLAQQTMADATEVQEFPQANANNPRVIPREVSDVTTRGSVSYRTHRLGTSDIARQEDGSLAWSYPIEPDGARNKLLDNQRGVLVANMTSMDAQQINVYEEDFTYGEGMWLHRSARWNVKLGGFFSKYNDDAVEFSHDGTPYLYYPKTGHEWHLLPFPHTTPKWNGGALVHPDGTIEHLSPEEAQANEILDGQRLYPMTLTRSETGSLGYREGIINQMPVIGAHEGQIEVAHLPEGADNEQPFVIDLEGEQMSYVTAMEPYGEDTRGLDEVWFADADTGEYTYFGTDEETLTGPEKAMGMARNADSQTGWGDNFVVTEPVPVTVDGDLWWHIKVAPVDFTDVTRSVFVNADANNAIELNDDAAIREFLRGDIDDSDLTPGENGTDVEPAPDDENILYYVLITDENGDIVDRIPVERGQDTQIVAPDDERAANETSP